MQEKDRARNAIIAFVIGFVNLALWFIPLCGLPFVIIGLACGYSGRDSNLEKLAKAGIVMAYIGLAETVIKFVMTLPPPGTG